MPKVSAKLRYPRNNRRAISKQQRANNLLSQIDIQHGGLVVPLGYKPEKKEKEENQ